MGRLLALRLQARGVMLVLQCCRCKLLATLVLHHCLCSPAWPSTLVQHAAPPLLALVVLQCCVCSPARPSTLMQHGMPALLAYLSIYLFTSAQLESWCRCVADLLVSRMCWCQLLLPYLPWLLPPDLPQCCVLHTWPPAAVLLRYPHLLLLYIALAVAA